MGADVELLVEGTVVDTEAIEAVDLLRTRWRVEAWCRAVTTI